MIAKKQNKESPEKQFERFQKAVQDMVDAGELNPTEAEERFEKAMGRIASIAPEPTTRSGDAD